MPVYDEIWDGPGRNIKRVNGQPVSTAKWYITVHNTSNDASAAQEADYAKVRTDGVGAHYFIDNLQVLQSTNTDWCVGHVGSAEGNSRGISYEITGFNGWTRDQWLSNVAWDALAAVIARDCAYYGIPVRLLTIAQMRAFTADLKGFVTHDMCRQAWGGTTHTDPGPGFPMDHLMKLVQRELTGDDMSEWSQPDPFGPDPDGHNRTPAQKQRDAYAAVFFGERPVGTDGNPVGPPPWIVEQINALAAGMQKVLDALKDGMPAAAKVDLTDAALDEVENRVDRQLDQQSLGGADNDAASKA